VIEAAAEAFHRHVERGGRHDDNEAALRALHGAAERVAGEPATERDAAHRYFDRLRTQSPDVSSDTVDATAAKEHANEREAAFAYFDRLQNEQTPATRGRAA